VFCALPVCSGRSSNRECNAIGKKAGRMDSKKTVKRKEKLVPTIIELAKAENKQIRNEKKYRSVSKTDADARIADEILKSIELNEKRSFLS
jgi:hypothetical protein